MDRLAAHKELRELLTEAVSVLGNRRVALGAGCSLTAIEYWLRCQRVEVKSATVDRVLPRLRQWRTWVPGYLAGRLEISRLEGDGVACWSNRMNELQDRLDSLWETYSLNHLALACEVSDRQLLLWRAGVHVDRGFDAVLRALGHLRHVDAWPESAREQQVQSA